MGTCDEHNADIRNRILHLAHRFIFALPKRSVEEIAVWAAASTNEPTQETDTHGGTCDGLRCANVNADGMGTLTC